MKERKEVTIIDFPYISTIYYPDSCLGVDIGTVFSLEESTGYCAPILEGFKLAEFIEENQEFDELCDSVVGHFMGYEFDDEDGIRLNEQNHWVNDNDSDLYPICRARFKNMEIFVYLYALTAVRDLTTGKVRFFRFD